LLKNEFVEMAIQKGPGILTDSNLQVYHLHWLAQWWVIEAWQFLVSEKMGTPSFSKNEMYHFTF